MLRQVKDTDIVGKTIKSLDDSSINHVKITFADDTTLELWAEQAIFTPMGNIPGIFVDDNSIAEEK